MFNRTQQDAHSALLTRHAQASRNAAIPSFKLVWSDGSSVLIGQDGGTDPSFSLCARTPAGDAGIRSLDLLVLGEAYLAGDIDIDGSASDAARCRVLWSDRRVLAWIRNYGPQLLGYRGRNRQHIETHYDKPASLFSRFLDDRYMCYTHGLFGNESTPLEDAIETKLGFAFESLECRAGSRVLDVGGGWGAFLKYGSQHGLDMTSVTISRESARYMRDLLERESLKGEVVLADFFDFETPEQFDAIVNMGSTEHMPNYRRTFRQYYKLLKPGGILYVDALAMIRGYNASSFLMTKVYPGGQSALVLPRYLRTALRSRFEVLGVHGDRFHYARTCELWANRLEAARASIESEFGRDVYRTFYIWLTASVAGFEDDLLQAYRLVLRRR